MTGLPVGRLIETGRPSRWRAVRGLFRPDLPDREAVGQFMAAFWDDPPPGPAVSLNTSCHTCTIAPPSAGKTTGLVIPFARACPDGMVIHDVKGEIYRHTHAARRAMGHTVVALDPWRQVTHRPNTLNPFDWEDPDDPEAIDFARDLGESLIVRGPHDEAHWPDMAEVYVAGAAAAVLTASPPGHRHLVSVADVLADRAKLDAAIDTLRSSTAWDGALARLGHVMSHAGREERESILSTANRNLRFVQSPAAAASLRASDFDPGELAKGLMTCYLVVPVHHLRPMRGLVRLWLAALHRAVVRGGVRE